MKKRNFPPPAPKEPHTRDSVKVIEKTGNAFADAVAKTSAKGLGYTTIVTAKVAEKPSIGAAKRKRDKRKERPIKLSPQELAIVNSAINYRFERCYEGAEYGTVNCEAVDGAYTYTFRIIEKTKYVFLRKDKIE